MNITKSGVDFSLTQQVKNTPIEKSDKDKQELKKACKQFESIFLNYLLKSMRSTIPDGGLFERSIDYDIIESMHDEALAEEIARSGGIGLATQLYEQLSKYV